MSKIKYLNYFAFKNKVIDINLGYTYYDKYSTYYLILCLALEDFILLSIF